MQAEDQEFKVNLGHIESRKSLKDRALSNACEGLDSIPTTETKTKHQGRASRDHSDALDPIGLSTMKMEAWAMLSVWERQYRKSEEGLTLRWLCYLRVGCWC